jgi:N4-gp56 family major capsid protein
VTTTYTGLTSTDAATLGTSLVQTAYDRLVEKALRAYPMFRAVSDKRPAQQSMPGSSIVFQIYGDMTAATTALTETDDPDAVALPSTSNVVVTLAEYGNVTLTTRKLELFSLSDVDPAVADQVAYNMADSLDVIVQTVLRGGTNVIRENGGNIKSNLLTTGAGTTGAVASTDVIKSRDIRTAVAKLRAGKVVPRKGDYYWCALHPEVSLDLRAETGAGGWRTPHEYSANDAIWNGEIGLYEGAFFIESPRCYNTTDGSSSARVYRSYVAGRQALAEAVAQEFSTVIGNVTDKLLRFRPLGWYGVAGWALYRQAALIRLETSSSIAA